jgi:hypothetical protein
MKDGNLPGLSPLWLVSLALVLGVSIVVAVPISIATGDTIKLSDWIGFAGSIAGAAMTLLAATFAWFAVQKQIKAQEVAEQRAKLRSDERRATDHAGAKYAAGIVLTHPVHAAAAVLNVTVRYIEALRTTVRDDVKVELDTAMILLQATMNHFAIREAWKDLDSEDKGNYLVVTSTLHTIMNIYANPPPKIGRYELVLNQRDALNQFAIYLRAFDAELADIYERDSNISPQRRHTDPKGR